MFRRRGICPPENRADLPQSLNNHSWVGFHDPPPFPQKLEAIPNRQRMNERIRQSCLNALF